MSDAKPKKPAKPAKVAGKGSTTVRNEQKLVALGAERLASLLLEAAAGDPTLKRRLRLELAGTQSPQQLAREIRKRLGQLARTRAFVDWHKIRSLADDLDAQRGAILEVGRSDAAEALELMWSSWRWQSPSSIDPTTPTAASATCFAGLARILALSPRKPNPM